jgi:ribose 5-phosphate isomerase B
MKVYLATDHTGLSTKDKVYKMLLALGYDVQDCGAFDYNENDDYPDFIGKAAAEVSKDPVNHRGIVFGGSGQGEAIAANKFKGVRCALFYTPALPKEAINIEGDKSTDPYAILKLTREHNDANMLSIGFRFVGEEDILEGIKIWLQTPGATAERHLRRIQMIKQLEESQ